VASAKSFRRGPEPADGGSRRAAHEFGVVRDESRPIHQGRGLTTTQVAIIDLIAEGRTDKEIAYAIGMAYRTVRTHLERLYNLNGVHCRAALVAVHAQRHQLPKMTSRDQRARVL
jgi:DNA-binding NarL/FixJ family response regulator